MLGRFSGFAGFLATLTLRSFILAAGWLSGTFAESGCMTTSWQPAGGLGADWDSCYIGVLVAIAADADQMIAGAGRKLAAAATTVRLLSPKCSIRQQGRRCIDACLLAE